jgi:hypothetical protein
MIDLLVWAFWFIFGAYSVWFFTKAKTLQPMPTDHLALIWQIHKQQTTCEATQIHSILMKNNYIVGFECNCGYKFIQKRPITKKVPTNIQTSIMPLTFSKNGKPMLKAKDSIQKLGIRYMHIKRI